MADQPLELAITLEAEGIDDADLMQIANRYRHELLEVEGVSLARLTMPTPSPDARGESVTIGRLALAILPQVIPAVAALLAAFIVRSGNPARMTRLKLGESELELSEPLSVDELTAHLQRLTQLQQR